MGPLRSAFGEDTDLVFDRDFQVLLIANMSAPLGTALVSPLLDSLLVPLSVSEARVGLVMAIFTAPSIFLTPLAGGLSDRYGRKPILLVGLVLFGVAGMGIAAASTFSMVIALRFLQGIGYAGITPILVTSIGDYYIGNTEATAQGMRFTSSGVIQAVFPFLAGILVTFSWRYPFLLYASALPIAFVVYRWFEEPTETRDRGRPSGRGRIRTVLAIDRAALAGRLRWYANLVLSRPVLAAIIARSTPPFVYFGFLTYNSIIVRSMGGTATDAGILVAVASVAYALSASQSGRVNAYFATRTAPLILTNLVMAASLVLIGLAPSVLVVGMGVVGLGFGFGISLSLYRSYLTNLVSGAHRGTVVSAGESTGRAAITLVPVAMGGLLALLEPVIGFNSAIRLTVLAVAIVPNLLGVGCMASLRYWPGPRSEPG